MRNITSLSIWAPDKPNPKTTSDSPPYCHSPPGRFWQKGVLGILEKLVRAGVELTHFGIHTVNDDDDPKERILLEDLLSRLTTEAPRYLPFVKTLDSSVDSCISRHQPKLRADRILYNGRGRSVAGGEGKSIAGGEGKGAAMGKTSKHKPVL